MINYNVLGQILDTSWGRSSTPNTSNYSLKFKLGDLLEVNYNAIVCFASEIEKQETKRIYDSESRSIIANAIRNIKALYKEKTGASLTIKFSSSEDNLEIINHSCYSPKRDAYYRRKSYFTLQT